MTVDCKKEFSAGILTTRKITLRRSHDMKKNLDPDLEYEKN